MPVPPDSILRAAARWLEHLPDAGRARCRALFFNHLEFSDLTPTQYESAYAWLDNVGLLASLRSDVPAEERVFDIAMEVSEATWFPDADILIAGPDDLPEDVARAAEALAIDEHTACNRLLAVWGKVDTARRAHVGVTGEIALVELLEEVPGLQVKHVALASDGYGYDVAVNFSGGGVHIEVKSTTRRGRLSLYLSRNEYEVMLSDPAWQLVVVRLTDELKPAAVATLPTAWIASSVPTDSVANGRWMSCRLDVPSHVLHDGVLALEVTSDEMPPILAGIPAWPG